jgi:hypothetical protein
MPASAGSLIARRGSRSATMAARQANEAVLPLYVMHEPVIVAAVWAVVRWHAPILGKQVSPVIVPFAGTLAPYEARSGGSASRGSGSA